jgi:hypothetical protein
MRPYPAGQRSASAPRASTPSALTSSSDSVWSSAVRNRYSGYTAETQNGSWPMSELRRCTVASRTSRWHGRPAVHVVAPTRSTESRKRLRCSRRSRVQPRIRLVLGGAEIAHGRLVGASRFRPTDTQPDAAIHRSRVSRARGTRVKSRRCAASDRAQAGTSAGGTG